MSEPPQLYSIELFKALSEVPTRYRNRNDALKRIAEIGREAMGSHTFTLALIDFDSLELTQLACSSREKELETIIREQSLNLVSDLSSKYLKLEVLARGEFLELYNLKEDGQGIANPEIAKKYDFDSLLSCPLKSEDILIGYINHFSSGAEPFTDDEKRLLEVIARQSRITIESFEYQQTLNKFNDLSKSLIAVSADEFINIIAEKACELLSVPICIIWKSEESEGKLKIVGASPDVDEEYKKIELDLSDPRVDKLLSLNRVDHLPDISKSNNSLPNMIAAESRGWGALLRATLSVEGKPIGVIDVFTKRWHHFKKWNEEFFAAFANLMAISWHKAELLRESEAHFNDSMKFKKLTETILNMTNAETVEELMKLLLRGSLPLVVEHAKGDIHLLDYTTGDLNLIESSDPVDETHKLRSGSGFTGEALGLERPVRIDDRGERWAKTYVKCWEGMRSELAIPIVIDNAPVRIGREVRTGSKPIGVLNIESEEVNAFSQVDEDRIWSLTRQAALLIENIESNRKLRELHEIDKDIGRERDYDRVIQIVMDGIIEILGFEYVNISLVVPEQNIIRTEHITGIAKEDVEIFKRLAVHSLDSNDIQAHIVKTREIEVPDVSDPRFDKKISNHFKHERFVRVFIPMIESVSHQVVGTVEAGYRRAYRKYIYERDVRILRSFVEYATQALEQKKSDLLDRISHEFRAPIVGIRNNANFLRNRFRSITEDYMEAKLDDISTDCEILLNQVTELEYFLGRPPQTGRMKRVYIFRDVFIKTINQLKPVIAEQGLPISNIKYSFSDVTKVVVRTDRAKLNQVAYNLLMNAIKYANTDPEDFRVEIVVSKDHKYYFIKFRDFGIGIDEKYKEKIFEPGFRAPAAVSKNVSGTGLGLAISRTIMRELGGDLKLSNNSMPTEFLLVLPK